MPKQQPVSFHVENISINIDPDLIFPKRMQQRMMKVLSANQRQRINDRLDRGIFPGASLPSSYSIRPIKVSTDHRRSGPLYSKEWPNIVSRMEGYAGHTKRWIKFPGGYRQFRSVAGKQSSRVDLQLTGQMLFDLKVRGMIIEKNAKLKMGGKAKKVANIRLEIGFQSMESYHLALIHNITRPFAIFTAQDINDIEEEALYMITKSVEVSPNREHLLRNEYGQFIAMPF